MIFYLVCLTAASPPGYPQILIPHISVHVCFFNDVMLPQLQGTPHPSTHVIICRQMVQGELLERQPTAEENPAMVWLLDSTLTTLTAFLVALHVPLLSASESEHTKPVLPLANGCGAVVISL